MNFAPTITIRDYQRTLPLVCRKEIWRQKIKTAGYSAVSEGARWESHLAYGVTFILSLFSDLSKYKLLEGDGW